MKHLFQQWLASLFIIIGWVTFAPTARAVDPPPDGGCLNQNTAEGEDALFSLTTGELNTAGRTMNDNEIDF